MVDKAKRIEGVTRDTIITLSRELGLTVRGSDTPHPEWLTRV